LGELLFVPTRPVDVPNCVSMKKCLLNCILILGYRNYMILTLQVLISKLFFVIVTLNAHVSME